jgi:oxygen-dependent protoporphyrinogen oxidase
MDFFLKKDLEAFGLFFSIADCYRISGNPTVFRLIEKLGLNDEVLFGDTEKAKRRFLVFNGRPTLIPTSLRGALAIPAIRRQIFPLIREFFRKSEKVADESIEAFFSRRISPEFSSTFIAPLSLGIFAGNISKLSAPSCFGAIHETEQQHGSILKGMIKRKPQPVVSLSPFVAQSVRHRSGLFSFKNGIEQLIHGLVEDLKGQKNVELLSETSISTLKYDSNLFQLELTGKHTQSLEVATVVSSLPLPSIASLIENSRLKQLLSSVEYGSVAVVNVGYNSQVFDPSLEGFGFLIPPKEKAEILGVTMDHVAFPSHNQTPAQTRLTVMLGGDTSVSPYFPDVLSTPIPKIEQIALNGLKQYLNIDQTPDFLSVTICRQGIPQYHVGHRAKVTEIQELLKSNFKNQFFQIGNYSGGVGVNDCIINAANFADTFEWKI